MSSLSSQKAGTAGHRGIWDVLRHTLLREKNTFSDMVCGSEGADALFNLMCMDSTLHGLSVFLCHGQSFYAIFAAWQVETRSRMEEHGAGRVCRLQWDISCLNMRCRGDTPAARDQEPFFFRAHGAMGIGRLVMAEGSPATTCSAVSVSDYSICPGCIPKATRGIISLEPSIVIRVSLTHGYLEHPSNAASHAKQLGTKMAA
jgi:hypothetical protein